MTRSDTIYAVSSGKGKAGIAVVRVSGTGCLWLLNQLTDLTPVPRFAHFVRLLDRRSGEVIDRCLVLFFPGPASVTGEDVLELHLHGGLAIVQKLFSMIGEMSGFRPAQAGEMTRRAFANGKLNLLEVEGLADVLAAENEPQRKLAMRQFLGHSSTIYNSWRDQLLACIAMVEAAIDFNDEPDVADRALASAKQNIKKLLDELDNALLLAARAHAVRTGIRLVIGGAPNVGKSSLLNALAGRPAAIVSPLEGTTRDVIEAPAMFAGIPVVLVDTAGMRDQTEDFVELEGMARAQKQFEDADILVWVAAADVKFVAHPPRQPDLILFNKIDLGTEKLIHLRNEFPGPDILGISITNGQGLPEAVSALEKLLDAKFSGLDSAVVVRERHRQAVQRTLVILRQVQTTEVGLELLADDLRGAAQHLAAVTGHIDVEDFLGRIFSEFCIGK